MALADQNYDPANLLIILDNSRNMRRTLELISMFDSDTFAGQRVRAFETKNGRPTDLAKELDDIFKAYSLSGDKGSSAVRFLPINRINTILAVAPNPGTFTEVEKWIQKLDIPAKVTVGSVDNYVYKLKYGRAEILGGVINQLYGGCGFSSGGMYGGMPGIRKAIPLRVFPGRDLAAASLRTAEAGDTATAVVQAALTEAARRSMARAPMVRGGIPQA